MADSLLVDRIARQRGPSLAAWANGRIGSASARPPPLVGWCRRRFGRSARAGRSPLGKSVPPDRDERQRNGNREATLCARAQGMETLMRRKMLILTSSLIFFLFAPLALGTCAANWTATGSLNIARGELDITAKLLDGRVLYAGGDFPGRSAELYDPLTQVFTRTGNLNAFRENPAVDHFSSGKVLVAGGFDQIAPGTVHSSAEVHDPATGLWSLVGSMTMPRAVASATLLTNGKRSEEQRLN